jgi:alcohol dehydrogenase (cytochrome c)
MFAINKATGEVVWERKIAEPALGETLTIAPLIIRDLAIVGAAGGEFGIRGYIEATDLNTGKSAWRTYTIPGAGEPGNETWKDGKERWKHGGGSVWETATYDPESDTFYQGIGNAGPDYDIAYRPGDNKWAASVLALSPNDGKIKWGFQYTPNDPYDYDEISEHPIINAKVNGEDRKLVVHAARNGFFYALDRTNGSFIAGKQYVDEVTWTPGLDPKTGRPLNYDPNSDIQIYAPGSHGMRGQPASRTCPSNSGGKNWEPTAYNPLQSRARPALHSLHRRLQRHPDGRAKGFRRPGRRRQAARALYRRQHQEHRTPLRRPQSRRSHHRRDQGQSEAHLSELLRRPRDRRQPGVPRPARRHLRRL